jgi:hypothetical protein
MKHAIAIIVGLLVVLGFALALTSCGPVTPPPKAPSFFLVLHNDANTTQKVTVTAWWSDFAISDSSVAAVASHTARSFRFQTPTAELVDVKAGWGHASWSGPEIGGHHVLHVVFPTGASWTEF